MTSAPGLPDRVTANVKSPPSPPEASVTDSVAGSLALIVPVPVLLLRLIPGGKLLDGSVRVTVNVSGPSARLSSVAATVNVCDRPAPLAPASIVTVPEVLVKSDCNAVLPDAMLVA